MLGPYGNADAGADADGMRSEIEWRCQGSDHALRHQRSRLLIRQPRQQHGELIAADPCQRVAIANAALKTLPHELQRDIAHLVPEGVIDRLEAIEVQHEHGEHGAVAPRMPHGLMQAIGEQGAVRQSGEAIGVCQIDELLLGVVLLGDIPGEHDNGGFTVEHGAFQAHLQIERRIVPSSADAEISDRCVFGGSERLDQSIAFGIDHDVREGEAGQRIGGLKHCEECRIGEDDAAVAHWGERDHGAVGQHRAERSWIDRLVVAGTGASLSPCMVTRCVAIQR